MWSKSLNLRALWRRVHLDGHLTLLKLLESGLALHDPILYGFHVHVDKDEAQVVLPIFLQGFLIWLSLFKVLLVWLARLLVLVLKVGDQLLNVVVTLLERDFHDVYDFVPYKLRRILTLEHSLRAEFALVNLWDFSKGNDHSGFLRRATEGCVILVDE